MVAIARQNMSNNAMRLNDISREKRPESFFFKFYFGMASPPPWRAVSLVRLRALNGPGKGNPPEACGDRHVLRHKPRGGGRCVIRSLFERGAGALFNAWACSAAMPIG